MLHANCPYCNAELELHYDFSEGPPDEVGTECDCGKIPVWKTDWTYDVQLGEFSHEENEQAAQLHRHGDSPGKEFMTEDYGDAHAYCLGFDADPCFEDVFEVARALRNAYQSGVEAAQQRVNSDCPHCGDELFCSMCGENVLHRRAGEAKR